jgi:DNA-binding transcriptional regulator YhcF (GntR family)
MKTVVNASTGEVSIQPLTEEEIVELQARADALEAEEAEAYIEAAATLEAEEAAKESARAKLAALGLTEEEVAALIK